MWSHFLIVGLGGAIGAMLRHGAGLLSLKFAGPGYPWGTLFVNITGGFLMGLMVAWFAARGGDQSLRLLLGVGILGGFTTFSAFALDAVNMIQRGAMLSALLYMIVSVVAAIGALYLGKSVL